VFSGIAAAFANHVVIAVSAGSLLTLLPHHAVEAVVAVLFLAGAVLIWREGLEQEEEEEAEFAAVAEDVGFWKVASIGYAVIFVGEWGAYETPFEPWNPRSRGEAPTPNMRAAIGDAAWMTEMERNADLIIMGTHAYGTVGRALFGSVADDVVRHATVPVLICTDQADHRWPEDRLRRILVPLDGSALAETALPHARRLAQQFGASLDLVGIVDQTIVAVVDQGVQVGDFLAMLRAETRTYLERRASELRNAAVVVDVQARVGIPAAAIRQLADDLPSDVIVMATHGRGGVAQLLLGSVALRVLQHSRVPVLLVQPAIVAAERRAEAFRLGNVLGDEAPAPARSEAVPTMLRHDVAGSDARRQPLSPGAIRRPEPEPQV
jgi:nucleotide-binding universal stress UspA family protein